MKMNKKEALENVRKYLAMLDDEGQPSDEAQHEKAEIIQNAMDMGEQSPNSPNGEQDAMAKDTGGWKAPKQSADGQGQSSDERAKLRKKAFIAMMSK